MQSGPVTTPGAERLDALPSPEDNASMTGALARGGTGPRKKRGQGRRARQVEDFPTGQKLDEVQLTSSHEVAGLPEVAPRRTMDTTDDPGSMTSILAEIKELRAELGSRLGKQVSCPQMTAILAEIAELRAELRGRPRDNNALSPHPRGGQAAAAMRRSPASLTEEEQPSGGGAGSRPARRHQQNEEDQSYPPTKANFAKIADLWAERHGPNVEQENLKSMICSAFRAPNRDPEAVFCRATRAMSAAGTSSDSSVGDRIPPVKVQIPRYTCDSTAKRSQTSDLWSKRVVPYRDEERRDLEVGEKDYEMRELFLQRLEDELQLGPLEQTDGLRLPFNPESEIVYAFSQQTPGVKVTITGSNQGNDHVGCTRRQCKPWRELVGLKVEIIAHPDADCPQNLPRNEAGALWNGCTSNEMEDTWAFIEAMVQMVARAVDKWHFPTVAQDATELRNCHTLECIGGKTQGRISLTAAPRACDAHACHEDLIELWQAVAGQVVPVLTHENSMVEEAVQRLRRRRTLAHPAKNSMAVEEVIQRLRHRQNSALAGCHLLQHALQLRRTVVFASDSWAMGQSAKAGRKLTGPALLLALQLGDVRVVNALLSNKADPNDTYTEHCVGRYQARATCPLIFAALESEKANAIELLHCMLFHGANINARATLNCYVHGTITWAVCQSGRSDAAEILSYLLHNKADLGTSNGWCLEHPPMYLENACSHSSLHSAAQQKLTKAQKLIKATTMPDLRCPMKSFSSLPDVQLELCPARKYTALGTAVVKGARKLVKILVDAKAEVTRHELGIVVAVSNTFLVRVISNAAALGSRPEEALLLLKDVTSPGDQGPHMKADKGTNQSITSREIFEVGMQQTRKERLHYMSSQTRKDLLSELVSAVVTNPYAVQKLQQLVRDGAKVEGKFVDPALDHQDFISELIGVCPKTAGLMLDKIYFQEPQCPLGNTVPVQCFLHPDQQFNTVYTENTKWQRTWSRKIAFTVRWVEELSGRGGSTPELEVYAGSKQMIPRHLHTFELDDYDTRQDRSLVLHTTQHETLIQLIVKNLPADQEADPEPTTVKIEQLQEVEGIAKRLRVGERDIEVDLKLLAADTRSARSSEHDDDELDSWQKDLLQSNKRHKSSSACDIRILHIQKVIHLELFVAISNVPRTERLTLLQNSEALQAVIDYTWVTWARPQHLVVLLCSAIRVIGLLVWVVSGSLTAREVVSPGMCELVVMVCWSQFAAFAVIDISENFVQTAILRGLEVKTLNNSDWYGWLKDGLVIVSAVDGWGCWETCSYGRHDSIFAAALLICCWHFLYCLRPFRGLGYALVPILDTLSVATPETGTVSNLGAMLIIVAFLVIAIGLFAVVELGDAEEELWIIFVKTFANMIVGESHLVDLRGFSTTHFGVVATMGAFFFIGVVLMNILIAVIGTSYDEMLKYNLGSCLARRNQICEKSVLLRRMFLQYTTKFVPWRGPLGAPEWRRGPSCLFGLVTPLQATLLKQVWIGSCMVTAFVGVVGWSCEMEVVPLLIVISIIELVTSVKTSTILCHTAEPPGGISKARNRLWFIPQCYVWAATRSKEGGGESVELFD